MQPITDLNIVRQELYNFITSNILAEGVEVNPDTKLSQIGVDSFSVIEIILFIERRFGVILPDELLIPENLKSIEALARCTWGQIEAR